MALASFEPRGASSEIHRLYHYTTGDSTIVTIFYFVLHIFSGKPNSKCLLTVLTSNHDKSVRLLLHKEIFCVNIIRCPMRFWTMESNVDNK